MYNQSLRVSADPWAQKLPRGLAYLPIIMKYTTSIIMHDTLCSLNLSHMDFLDDPAAIHRCRLIISRAKQDASPNELMNPENSMKNHHQNTHSFALVLPAIFPDTDISSCVCIVLLFETSSSSHVQSIIPRQRGPLAETATRACLTASDHEICHDHHHPRNLVLTKSLAYGFSG